VKLPPLSESDFDAIININSWLATGVQVTAVALKFAHIIDWSWWLVMLPTIGALWVVMLLTIAIAIWLATAEQS
jgi:hypothetical protein